MEVDAQFDVASVGELPYVPPADEATDVAMNANEVSRTAVKRDTAEDEDDQLSNSDENDSGDRVIDSASPPMVPPLEEPPTIDPETQLIEDSEFIRTHFCVREYNGNLLMECFVPPKLGPLFSHGKIRDMQALTNTLEDLALAPPRKKVDPKPAGCGMNREMLDTEKGVVRGIIDRSSIIAAKCLRDCEPSRSEGVLQDVRGKYERLVRMPWEHGSSNVSSSALGLDSDAAAKTSEDCAGGRRPETEELNREFNEFCVEREQWIRVHKREVAGARTADTRLRFEDSLPLALALSKIPVWDFNNPASAIALVKLSLRSKETSFFDWAMRPERSGGRRSMLEDSHDPTMNLDFNDPYRLPPSLRHPVSNQPVLPPSRMLSDDFRASQLPGGFFLFRISAAVCQQRPRLAAHSSKLETSIAPSFPWLKLSLSYSLIDKGTVMFDAGSVPFLGGYALMVVCVRPKNVHAQLIADTDRAWNDASQFVELFHSLKRPSPFRLCCRDLDSQEVLECFLEHFHETPVCDLPGVMWLRNFCSMLLPAAGPFSMDSFRLLIIPGFELLSEYLTFDKFEKRLLLSDTLLRPLLDAIADHDLTVPERYMYHILSCLQFTCGSLFRNAWDGCMEFHIVCILGMWELSGQEQKEHLVPLILWLCAIAGIVRPIRRMREAVRRDPKPTPVKRPPLSYIHVPSVQDYVVDELQFVHKLLWCLRSGGQMRLRAELIQHWASLMSRFVLFLQTGSTSIRVRPTSLTEEPKHRNLRGRAGGELELNKPIPTPEGNIVLECKELLQTSFHEMREFRPDTEEPYVPNKPLAEMLLCILQGQFVNNPLSGFGPWRTADQEFLLSLPSVSYCAYLVQELLVKNCSIEEIHSLFPVEEE